MTRGAGIYQEHMNEALEKLSNGAWVFTFILLTLNLFITNLILFLLKEGKLGCFGDSGLPSVGSYSYFIMLFLLMLYSQMTETWLLRFTLLLFTIVLYYNLLVRNML